VTEVLRILDDPSRAVLARAMDACAVRNRVIASNIANADTPGYRRAYVRFEESLKQMLAEGGPRDVGDARRLTPSVEEDTTPSARLDGNNVNLDAEMADLARNSIEYNALVELYRLKGQMISTVINGGTR